MFGTGGDLAVRVTQRDGHFVTVREGVGKWVPLAEWMHVALVADGATLRLYRNGAEVASTPCAGVLPKPPMTSLSIGCKLETAAMTPAPLRPGYWFGRIDELAIFNKALSPEEIKKLAVQREGLKDEM